MVNRDLEFIHQLFNQGPVVVFQWKHDATWTIVSATPNASRLLGQPASLFEQKTCSYLELIHTEDRAAFVMGHPRRHEGTFHLDYRIRRSDGVYLWVQDYCQPVFEAGHQIGWIGYVVDVTAKREIEQRFKDFATSASDWFWETDTDYRFTYISDNLMQIAHHHPESLLGRSRIELSMRSTREEERLWERHLEDIHAQRPFRNFEYPLKTGDGRVIVASISGTPFYDPSGSFAGYRGCGSDITEARQHALRLKLAGTFFENINDAILITDKRNTIVMVNPAYTHITGYSAEEAIGNKPSFMSSGKHTPDFYKNLWNSLKTTGKFQGEVWNRRKNGEIFPEWLSINAIQDEQGEVIQHVAIFSDISARKAAEQMIWHQAHYDSLTGLANRVLFMDRLNQNLLHARRDTTKLALLFIDLDRFKWVNDHLGHKAGDELLQKVSSRLQISIRESDTVARLGGDEFTVILPKQQHYHSAGRVAEIINRALSEPFLLEKGEVTIGSSIGIAVYPSDGEDADALLSAADSAMYTAKAAGRGCYAYADADGPVQRIHSAPDDEST